MNAFNSHVNRRHFLKSAALTAGAVALPAWYLEECRGQAATPAPRSPNDKPGIGLIGCGGQGRGDCNWARSFGNVIAVADVDDGHAEAAKKQFNAEHKYHDFRKLIERDDIHVIINGTPDHWHTLVNVAAARAGKDIYSEKPLTLTIAEGKRLVREVRQRERILQVGSQQRSDPRFRLACELVRNGRIGKLVHMVVGLPTGPREGPFKPIPTPAGFDWDYYLGQAPKMEYVGLERKKDDGTVQHESRCSHWNFRWWYCFSGGQMTDWGAHHNDIAQWGNGTERSGPVAVDGKGLVEMIPGGYDAMAKYRIDCRYANGVTMTIVDEGTVTDRNVLGEGKRSPNGVQFIGTEGWIFVSRGELKASRAELIEEPLPASATRLYKSDNHMANFFECVRSRKAPICDVEIGHRSISIAHLGVISVRLGRPLQWDPDLERFVGDREANQWLRREMRKPYDWTFIA
ncbi:MAG: gfo/Idh/MocA family oxidoreductase [Verrucomicrobia bacterium]|nr:gfo/Idh/MocA family oxidoreductase [Verrucomicrobiota bacterium]